MKNGEWRMENAALPACRLLEKSPDLWGTEPSNGVARIKIDVFLLS
jgi:hypothetical protein